MVLKLQQTVAEVSAKEGTTKGVCRKIEFAVRVSEIHTATPVVL